jgi:aminopeptidase-like protein
MATDIPALAAEAAANAPGQAMQALIARLYPICRSITGNGVRQTLAILQQQVPLEIHEVPSGTPVFDWVVPLEWNISDAFVKNGKGARIIDFQAHNLHLVNYSRPFHGKMSLADLRPHLHAEAAHPDWIPYRTSYYQDNWGFCLPWTQLQALPEDEYEVAIDATLAPGSLTYGECFLPGTSEDEVLVSAHICHPSLANDNLSGLAIVTELIRGLMDRPHRLSYRFILIPGTIGSITWLARNEARLGKIKAGLVAVNLGDPGMMQYKRSRQGKAGIDRAVEHVLKAQGDHRIHDFSPYGYDERQFCSPGIDLPVGCLSRTPYGQFPEYHTSADNLDLVRPEALEHSLSTFRAVFALLERDGIFLNLSPKGEPQLGRRGLYAAIGGRSDGQDFQMAMLWVLNLSDGAHSLLDIAERAALPFALIADAAEALVAHDLLARQ